MPPWTAGRSGRCGRHIGHFDRQPQLQPGDAFFAIKGEAMDGHDFATAAIKAGAGVLVVAEGKLPSLGRLTAPIIVVEDVLAALEKLGVAAARPLERQDHRGETGSAGKTTTKEALRHVLSAVGKVMPRRSPSTTIGACR